MAIPTVKSCCCMNLKAAGYLLAIIQVLIYSLPIIFNLDIRGYLILPIIFMPVVVNICWICGIQKKKPMLMIPAMIPFAIASLVCMCFITILPIGIAFSQHVFTSPDRICSSYSHYVGCSSKYYFNTEIGEQFICLWIAGCAISCVVVYLTIIFYSVYKSVEEEHKRNRLHLPTSDSNQNIGFRV